MAKQLIISVGREYGSGGHEIAQKLAEAYKLPIYDHNLLDEAAAHMNIDTKALKEFDERGRNKLLYRSVKGMSSSPSENVAQIQFDYLKKKADAGESFVVVGRCAEAVLQDNPGLISIFVLGDEKAKLERIMRLYQLTEDDAKDRIAEKDRRRKYYHNSHCKSKWGDSRSYDITVNSTPLGVDETAKLLQAYIDARIAR